MIEISVIDLKGERVVFIPSHWQYKELIKTVPGVRYLSARGGWSAPLSWATLVTLRGVLGDMLDLHQSVIDWAWNERRTRVDPMLALRGLTEPPSDEPTDYGFDERLYPFQRVGARFLIEGGSILLGDEMGTGKTAQALSALKSLHTLGRPALPALVVCPNSVKGSWLREISMWFPEARGYALEGSAAVKRRQLLAASEDPLALVIMNWESTWRLSRMESYGSMSLRRCRACDPLFGEEKLSEGRCDVHPKPLNELIFNTVIADEAHRMKDPHSKQTRATWALMHAESVKRVWGMTGTPIANDPGELWAIMHGVCKREYPTKTKFIDRYCLTSWNGGGGLQVAGIHPATRDEFYRFFDPRFRRMPKALVLTQLPPKIRVVRTVEMSPKQRKTYDQLNEQFLAWLNDGNVLTVANNLAKRIRLMQLASSYAEVTYDVEGDWTTSHVKLCEPSHKLDELEQVLAELGDRAVVVTAESRQLIMMAHARLTARRVPTSLIVGGMTTYARDDNLRDFQEGRTRVMLMTTKAGGTGLTMTAADTIIFLQRSDSMVDNKQAEDRVHRIGSERHEVITVIDIITIDSVEVGQVKLINEKLARLDEITRDRATYTANGLDTGELDREEYSILNVNVNTQ